MALAPAPVRFEDLGVLCAYLETMLLAMRLDRLFPGEVGAFARAVAERLPEPVLDFVRLTATARRAPA